MPEHALDSALLDAIRGGDRIAYERFFRAWYPRLADYAHRLLGGPDQAEDATQEVLIELWRRHDVLPPAEQLSAYLHRSVRNRALNQLRSRQRTSSGDPEDLPGQQIAPVAQRRLMEADLAAAFADAMADLAPRTREVFVLSREQAQSYAQIAETVGISVETVEMLMGRALAALRHRVGPINR